MPLLPPHRAAGSGTNSHYWSFETKRSHYMSYQDSECYLISALELQLRVEPVVQRRLLQNDTDLALAVWRETLDTQTHALIWSIGAGLHAFTEIRVTNLVCVFEFEAGDDLPLQLVVVFGVVQNVLAELWDVCFASLPQHRVQTVV